MGFRFVARNDGQKKFILSFHLGRNGLEGSQQVFKLLPGAGNVAGQNAMKESAIEKEYRSFFFKPEPTIFA